MDRPPWKRDWLDVSPEEFELQVVEWLRQEFGTENLEEVRIEHQPEGESADGIRCKLDARVRVRWAGMDYVTVVECKHQRRPVEGEVVDVLAKKVERYRHEGLLVSTGGFQRGALQRADVEKIALVHMTAGGPVFKTRSRTSSRAPRSRRSARRPPACQSVHLPSLTPLTSQSMQESESASSA